METKIAVVTGGASGIGEGIVRSLASAGVTVAILDLDEDRGKEVASDIQNVFFFATDVTDSKSTDAAVAAATAGLGDIDILVNCAGADIIRPFLETDESIWKWLIELNLMGVFRTCKTVLPGMIEKGWGRVINIASDAGRVGSSGEAVYSGAKGGVISFSKTLAREMASAGITVNVVCPGPTDTPATRKNVAEGGEKMERLMAALTRSIPVGRLGQPSDLGAAVTFLASEGASFITGQTISVSGGMTMV